MTDDAQQNAKDARLEWLLHEQVGNESPPDLQHAVLGKLQAEQATQARPRRGNHLLAAAIALIGIAAVVAVSLLSEPAAKATAKTPQDPASALLVWKQPKLARSAKDIESLPIDTRQVFGVNLDDDAMTAMLRLKNLEALALTVSTFERPKAQILGKKPAPVFVTSSGIERLAALPKLRALVLEGQLKLKGSGIAKVVSNTRVRELKLMNMAVTDDMLRGVCTAPLISLQLHYSQTFGDKGLKAIAACQTLQLIALTGCRHLEDKWIANLSGLNNLEFLDLSLIGSHTMFSGMRVNPLPEEPPGSGVTDRLIQELAPLPKLRKLMLGVGDISDVGLLALKKFPALRDVNLSSMSKITASGLDSLPAHIETLSLFGHRGIDAKMLEVLLARPDLHDLNLGYCQGLAANAVDLLCNAKHLRKLDLSGWELNDVDRKRLAALSFEVQLPKQNRRPK